ncbi:MAG: insulinase family protein, partial [Leptospiraceae bacterium]|nr:insulinase family protein [Leptospiraceae bacterium]
MLNNLEARGPLYAALDNSASSDGSDLFDSIEKKIRLYTLNNGLQIIMLDQELAPVSALYIKILAGGSDETVETAGIAHMLEHMLFKGTEKIGTRDYDAEKKYLELIQSWSRHLDRWRKKLEDAKASGDDQRIKEAESKVQLWKYRLQLATKEAARFRIPEEDSLLYSRHGQRGYNAYTSRDLTNYQIQLPSNRIEVWAAIESDRLKNSVFREFYTERDVVAEERRMRVENKASSKLMENFLMEIYGNHPYGKPLIGPMKSIEYFNKKDAMDFYHKYYSPNNAVIAITGDFDPDFVLKVVKKHFGSWKQGGIIERPNPEEPRRRAVTVDLKEKGSPVMYLAWFKPALMHPDNIRLEVLASILADGQESILVQKLVQEKKLATSIRIYTGFPGERFTNLFFISAIPAPDVDYDTLEKAIQEELQQIRENGVSQQHLQKVQKKALSDFAFGLRSPSQLADLLSYYQIMTGDYKSLFRSYETMKELT